MKMHKLDRRFRLARQWSNRELKKFSGLFSGKIVNVSAGSNLDKEGSTYDTYFPNADEFWLTNYSPGSFRGFEGRPHEILLDLTKELPQEQEKSFDVVFNHTTLEHIFEVTIAFRNICQLSRDVVIIVVPFAQEQHENEGYLDYWRFTPTCMRRLFQLNGYTVMHESSNNNFNAAVYLFLIAARQPEAWTGQFPLHRPIEKAANWIGSRRNPINRLFGK